MTPLNSGRVPASSGGHTLLESGGGRNFVGHYHSLYAQVTGESVAHRVRSCPAVNMLSILSKTCEFPRRSVISIITLKMLILPDLPETRGNSGGGRPSGRYIDIYKYM